MNQVPSRRRAARNAAFVLSALALVAVPSTKVEAQCTLLAPASKFDPPSSGLPSYLQYQGRQNALGLGGAAGAKRLAVRYNYGFLVYSLASPGSPTRTSVEDMLGGDRYPKNGDGQERVGPVAMSEDGTRVLIPWTDVAAYGTVAMSSTGGAFASGGDFLPTGEQVRSVAVLQVGTRYLGFATSDFGVYAADITGATLDVGPSQKNGIPSELIRNAGVTSPTGITALAAGGRSYVVAWASDAVSVIDVSSPGPAASGLTANFTAQAYSKAQLGVGGSFITAVAAARHPLSGDLYLLAEGSSSIGGGIFGSAGVALNRVDPSTGALTLVGSYQPPAGAKRSQKQITLLPFDTDVVAVFLEGKDAGGLQAEVHSSADFATNLAATVPAFTGPGSALSLATMRPSGGNIFLYFLDQLGTYVASMDCSTAPSPAAATLTVDKVAYTGGTVTSVPDGGSVFIGDQLRIKPTFSPTDAVEPLTQWRLDYDFHDGNALDSNPTTFRVKSPDLAYSSGASAPTQVTLVGPCDPQGGLAATPSTGDGCWASVTTNGTYTVSASPDFDPVTPADGTLTIGFEVQNSLNGGSSSLKTHRVAWKVPRQLLKNASILSGGTLEDASEGSPLTTGYRWYLAQAPVGQAGDTTLTLASSCTGPTCVATGFTTPGSYRYWVSVPYHGGFRTAECPGLQTDQVTCSGDAARLVTVTDVVLSLTAPTQALVGVPSVTITSTSQKGVGVTPCPATGAAAGFSYNVCTVSGSTCTEGTYVTTSLTPTNPFPSSGSGTITIPTPAEGTKGLRVRYSYTTDGTCTTPKVAQWPATGYSPLTVLLATPTINLRNSSNTADITKSLGIYWELSTGQTARAYAQLNGVNDPNPPAALAWSYRPSGTMSETAIGTTQGAAFAISTVGEYEIVLRGYGSDVVNIVGVSSPTAGSGGGGGSGIAPTVSGVTFSKVTPGVSETVTVSCQATAGTDAIGSYRFAFGDGQEATGATASTSHAWATEGTKAVSCTAFDINGLASAPWTAYIDVGGPASGPTVTSLDVTPQYLRPGTLATLTCAATAPAGRLVAGYEFDFGDSTPLANGPSNVATHTYPSPRTYQATCRAYDWSGRSGFLQRAVAVLEPTYTISITKIGSGNGLVFSTPSGLSCGSICSATPTSGSTVLLDALPAAGSRFAGWSGSGCAGVGSCTILMTAARFVTANFLPEAGTRLQPIAPCRVADTRTGAGIPLAAGEVRQFPVVGGSCSVPASAQAVTLNVTVTQPAAQGFLTVFPAGAETPDTQVVSFSPNRTRAAPVLIQLGNGGAVSVSNASPGPVHVILDVSGAFQ